MDSRVESAGQAQAQAQALTPALCLGERGGKPRAPAMRLKLQCLNTRCRAEQTHLCFLLGKNPHRDHAWPLVDFGF